jgi:hypothetical protein
MSNSRIWPAYKRACGFEVRWLALVKKIYVKAVHDLDELAINVLQGLIVRLQGVDQSWATVQQFLG